MTSLQPGKIGGHKHRGSGDIMVLSCHVILEDHVMIGPYDFLGKKPSSWITILPSWVAIDTVVAEIYWF